MPKYFYTNVIANKQNKITKPVYNKSNSYQTLYQVNVTDKL